MEYRPSGAPAYVPSSAAPAYQSSSVAYTPSSGRQQPTTTASGLSAESQMVGRIYSDTHGLTREEREEQENAPLFKHNNWVKSVLIGLNCPEKATVFDICGGRGGDFPKWSKQNVAHVVLADIAAGSILEALERYNKPKGRTWPFKLSLVNADCFRTRICDNLPPHIWFDLVNCQFALHYSYAEEAAIRGLLANVTARLKPGGVFVGTMTNGNEVVRRVRAVPGLEFGNSYYHVTFDQKDRFTLYGTRYTFQLGDAVKDIPEYVVHFPSFQKLAAEYGLELLPESTMLFRDFLNKYGSIEPFRELRGRMCQDLVMNPEQDEVFDIYMTFAFKKVGDATVGYRPLSQSDILRL